MRYLNGEIVRMFPLMSAGFSRRRIRPVVERDPESKVAG